MQPDPGAQATRDYVEAEARSRTVEELIELVEAETRRFHEAARSAASATSAPPPGEEWEPMEATRHLVARSMLRAREVLWVALSGEVPAPEEPELPEDLEALLRLHREAINSLYEHVRAAPEDFASITWDHPFFGPM
ncbi:MAG: hypothetical protein ACRDHF_12440, partial [Tepidiformaceae bacterium]